MAGMGGKRTFAASGQASSGPVIPRPNVQRTGPTQKCVHPVHLNESEAMVLDSTFASTGDEQDVRFSA